MWCPVWHNTQPASPSKTPARYCLRSHYIYMSQYKPLIPCRYYNKKGILEDLTAKLVLELNILSISNRQTNGWRDLNSRQNQWHIASLKLKPELGYNLEVYHKSAFITHWALHKNLNFPATYYQLALAVGSIYYAVCNIHSYMQWQNGITVTSTK